jgi:hypothetical protein
MSALPAKAVLLPSVCKDKIPSQNTLLHLPDVTITAVAVYSFYQWLRSNVA